jgi:NAD-dependent DNA ligase
MKASDKDLVKKLTKSPKETLAKLTEDEIANIIQLANYEYYNTDKPIFLDNVFDMIKEHLEKINPNNPILKHVGAVVDDDRKTKLPYYMGSLDKLKSDSTTMTKWKTKHTGNVVVSDKLDGNSGMLYIKNGEAKLFTRGNGIEGQNISHLIPFIQNIPDFKGSIIKKYDELTVRGELIMNKSDFQKVKHLGANGRNMVAGLLNSKIPNLELAKYTQFISYELITPVLIPSKQFELMDNIGLKPVFHSSIDSQQVDAPHLSAILVDRRSKSEFEIDGIVVFHDALHNRKDGENPKHAFAFKSVTLMDRAEVIVTSVEWNVSKDRYIKPVVLFDAVNLGGAMIRRATGYNGKYIKDNKIGPGAKIVVMRSGDVIPKIIEIIEPATPSMPDMNYEWNSTGIDIIANESNSKNEVAIKNMIFFFKHMKVTGLSTGIVTKLYNGGIDTVGKVITVTKPQILKIDGFKDKSADKLLENLKKSFENPNVLLIMEGSNTFGRGIGESRLKLVSDKYPDILTNPKFILPIDGLISIEGIEKKTAEKIIEGLKNYWKFADENGLMKYHKFEKTKEEKPEKPKENTVPEGNKLFVGKLFIFTGVRSKETEAFIVANGGIVKKSMSKKTDVLICKDSTSDSGKMKEARELGITIISLDDFIKKYKI